MTIAAIVFLIMALALVAVIPLALQYIGLENSTQWIVTVARWPLLFAVVTLALAFIYRYGPSRREPQWRWVTWGSVFAALVWIAVSILFLSFFDGFSRSEDALMWGMLRQQAVYLLAAGVGIQPGRSTPAFFSLASLA